ncbi:MAG: hypothetical protein JO159_03590 [Acidobacteria bacterium]|nr:hypothetical protein [Acidobacteriota bacterium]MBV9622900.1 hypothetical protein [Acidobacteriota bacterium]
MPENRVEEMVRSAVAQALERRLASLRESIVEEVVRDLESRLVPKSAPAASSRHPLQKAITAIQAGTTQKEILRTLLDNTAAYCTRAVLFVLKSGVASAWQGIGFSGKESTIKDSPLDLTSPLAARVIESRSAVTGSSSEFDQRFLSAFGAPKGQSVILLPLLLKDKISALIYADGGTDGSAFDPAALDELVHATSAWLEVIAQRRQAQKDGASDVQEASAPAPASDPFAQHAPLHAGKAKQATETLQAMSMAASGGGQAVVTVGNDAEVHHKAQRFARLLMDEIKLYNRTKVAEGREHKDLYDRLKEDIEKSRATYQKRYGNTAAAAADYFNQELVHSLAEDDASLLGSNFRR